MFHRRKIKKTLSKQVIEEFNPNHNTFISGPKSFDLVIENQLTLIIGTQLIILNEKAKLKNVIEDLTNVIIKMIFRT